jgi:hypothetical protein
MNRERLASDDADPATSARPSRRRHRLGIFAAAFALAVLAATGVVRQCSEDVVEHATIGHFYEVLKRLRSRPPGTLVRSERLLGAPDGSVATTVLRGGGDVLELAEVWGRHGPSGQLLILQKDADATVESLGAKIVAAAGSARAVSSHSSPRGVLTQ